MIACQGSEPVWADLWLLDLSRRSTFTEEGARQLTPSEVQRASRFVSPEQGQQYLVSRIGLRNVLSQYGCDSSAEFELGPNGKPSLATGPYFSLSRTRLAALVVVSNSRIGVDLEQRRPLDLCEPNIVEAARRLRQLKDHGGIGPLQVWTAVEAWIKHHGHSMQWFLENDGSVHAMIDDLESGRVALIFPPLPNPLVGAVCAVGQSELWQTQVSSPRSSGPAAGRGTTTNSVRNLFRVFHGDLLSELSMDLSGIIDF